jgi:hypothetical protein
VRARCIAVGSFLAIASASLDATASPVLTGAWSPQERARVEEVLARVPAAILARAPRVVLRDRDACEPDGLPSDDDLMDGQGRMHLCAPGRSALDVGRQVVLALMFAFDRAARWSDEPAWRRINGWQLSLAHPLRPRPDNQSEAAFVAPRGPRSPRWDLVSFVAALFVDEDHGVGCRLLSQTAFVRRRLAALGAPPAPPACPAFERWADLDRLADVEIVLATPSTAMAASLFGHILVRLVYRDDDGATPLHVSQSVAFLADNDVPFAADRAYALKGIAGYFTASLHERPFLDAYREYVVLEGRDLRRWRLNLSPAERRDLMERIWTAERASRTKYYFFSRNCATLMLDLIDQARPSGFTADAPGLLAAPPASLLEPLARASGADGAPFLQFVEEPLYSFDHRARLTSRHRRDVEARIATRVDVADRPAVRAAFDRAHDAQTEVRAAAYDQLGRELAGRDAGDDADVRAWLQDSATIESHLSTLANLEAEARADVERHRKVRATVETLVAGLAADGAPVRDVTSDDPETRMVGYRGLLAFIRTAPDAVAARARLLALLQSEARYDVARMKGAPGGLRAALLFPDPALPIDEQAYVPGYADLIHVPVETRVSGALRSLQRTRRTLFVARHFDDASAADEPDALAAVIRSERREYDAAMSRSGIDQVAVLAGIAGDGAQDSPAAVFALEGALYDERLGDHRRFGFPSDTAMVVGRNATFVALGDRRPALRSYDTRLFGYRTVRRTIPESPAHAAFGWELYLDLAGNWTRNLAAEPKLGWGVLAPVFDRRDLGDHVLLGVGLAYHAYFPGGSGLPASRQHGLGAPASLEVRLGLGALPRHRSWIGGHLWVQPMAVGTGGPDRVVVDAGASLEAHLALRERPESGRHDPAVLVRVQATRSALSFDPNPERVEAIASAGLELR